MPSPKNMLHEYSDIAVALCDWFESQGLSGGRAIGVMAYLIGVMAADIGGAEADVSRRIDVLCDASKATALGVMAMIREGK